jgi:SAM-dependent methyltransferase
MGHNAEMNDQTSGGLREDADEVDRIRQTFANRDRRGPRSPAISSAYRLINLERQEAMLGLFDSLLPGPRPALLDVGCGGGLDLERWLKEGWPVTALSGVDVAPERVAAARVRLPGVDIRQTEGADLPYPDAKFAVATAVTVFSSILDPGLRRRLFTEMRRVVAPGGIVIVYDFVIRNPRNANVTPMTLRRLLALGERPTASVRITPLLHLVGAGSYIHPVFERAAMWLAPRTHRLTYWRLPYPDDVIALPAAASSR